jgi:hypothetical protein
VNIIYRCCVDSVSKEYLMRQVSRLLMVLTVVVAPSAAWARFGKAGSSEANNSDHSSRTSSNETHAARPVRNDSASSWSSGSSSYSYNPRPRSWFRARYGYTGFYNTGFVAAPAFAAASPPVQVSNATEETPLRATVGIEGMTYLNNERGLTLGLAAAVEGEAWGIAVTAQNIAVRAKDEPGLDMLQQANAHLTYAFVRDEHLRLRFELGGQSVFAPSARFFGFGGGLSGSLWVAGPLVLEASAIGTVYPFWQIDGRAGLALGFGPVGIRGGWRVQVLNDRGLVDGVVHEDTFSGPYLGLSVAF